MPAPKLNPIQQADIKAEIAVRYLRGELQSAIGPALSIPLSQGQISYYLKQLQAEWVRRAEAAIDQKRAAELAKIDALERTYWAAWEASTGKATKTTQHLNPDGEGKPRVARAVTATEERAGNPAYLAGVMSCISKRCEICGLNAPVNLTLFIQQQAERAALVSGLPPLDIVAECAAIIAEMRKL